MFLHDDHKEGKGKKKNEKSEENNEDKKHNILTKKSINPQL